MKLRERLYLLFSVVCCMIFIMTLVTSFQKTAGTADSAFAWGDGLVLVAVCAVFALVQLIGIVTFRPHLQIRTLGFYLVHVGILVFLLGCFLFYNAGTDVDGDGKQDNIRYVQVTPSNQMYSEYTTLGFGIGIPDAGVEYYEDGTPKYYYADIRLDASDGTGIKDVTLSVNHPYHQNGWKIYLMDYNDMTKQVTLLFKKDPGEYWTITGIWMIILGSVLMCLIRKRKKEENPLQSGEQKRRNKKAGGERA